MLYDLYIVGVLFNPPKACYIQRLLKASSTSNWDGNKYMFCNEKIVSHILLLFSWYVLAGLMYSSRLSYVFQSKSATKHCILNTIFRMVARKKSSFSGKR